MRAAGAELYRYRLPLAQPLHFRSRTLEDREGLLLRIVDEAGLEAWGEAAPLPGFSPEPIERIEAELTALVQRLPGYRFPNSYAEMEGAPVLRMSGACAVSFAVEACYFGLQAANADLPLYRFLGGTSSRVRLNALLAGPPDTALERAKTAMAEGYTAVKLKVGQQSIQDDVALVHEVRKVIGDDVVLRLDANRAWNPNLATFLANGVAECGIEYIEEPLKDPLKLLPWREESRVPYALDETLHSFHQALLQRRGGEKLPPTEEMAGRARALVKLFEHAEAVVWKPTLAHVPNMGAELRRGDFALPIRRVVPSASFESGVGIGLIAHYASAFAGADTACGLDTYSWLAGDVLAERLSFKDGCLDLEDVPRAPRLDTLTRVCGT